MESAERYKVEKDNYDGLEETKLYKYGFSGKLLDLREKKNRKKLPKLVKHLMVEDNNLKTSMREIVKPKFQDEKLKKDTTFDDIINDELFSGLSFWGQKATDYKSGIVIKIELNKIGYDGVIFRRKEFRSCFNKSSNPNQLIMLIYLLHLTVTLLT